MQPRRVVITGIGCITPLGPDVPTFWRRLQAGESAIRPIERTLVGDTVRFPAAEVPDYEPRRHFKGPELFLRDPFAQFALIAAREAIADAGITFTADPAGTAIVLGTGGGGETSREHAAVQLFAEKRGRCHPMLVPKTNNQAAVGLVSMEHGITGPAFVVSTGCAASTHAIAQAFDLIRFGRATSAITGGSEASILYSVARAFGAVQVLASDTCRPFSRDRTGMVLGEGAGVLVLEELEHARARGARIHAELLGAGMSADARDPVHPSPSGPAQAMRAALADARLRPEAIDHINAHGTGTVANDRAETAAIRDVFGAAADRIAVSATKSMHGHMFGGTGAVEAIAAVLALRHGVAPPTANYLGPDPECDLDYVPNVCRSRPIAHALSNSFAFGGLNVVLAFGHADAAEAAR